MTSRVVFSLIRTGSTAPTRATGGSAGFDLYADLSGQFIKERLWIPQGATVMVPTGLRTKFDSNIVGKIYARSGLSTKQGLRPANCVGVIDSDYPGEVMVALYNDSQIDRQVQHGDRIAQIIFEYIPDIEFIEQPEAMLNALHGIGERNAEGFGSTGS